MAQFDPTKRFWIVVYGSPDGENYRIRGLTNNGQLFDSYEKALAYLQQKVDAQSSTNSADTSYFLLEAMATAQRPRPPIEVLLMK